MAVWFSKSHLVARACLELEKVDGEFRDGLGGFAIIIELGRTFLDFWRRLWLLCCDDTP